MGMQRVVVATQFNHCLFVFGEARQLRAWRHGDGGRKVVYNKHALPNGLTWSTHICKVRPRACMCSEAHTLQAWRWTHIFVMVLIFLRHWYAQKSEANIDALYVELYTQFLDHLEWKLYFHQIYLIFDDCVKFSVHNKRASYLILEIYSEITS